MSAETSLLFVYNADSGLFNTLADIGHKRFSPQTYECALCALTHGYFSERAQWRSFIEQLPCRCDFLHRDEFLRRHPGLATGLPAVFVLHDGVPASCAGPGELGECRDLGALQRLIADRCCPGGSADPA